MADTEVQETPAPAPEEKVEEPQKKGPHRFKKGEGINAPVECPFCGVHKAKSHQAYCKKNPALQTAKVPPQVMHKQAAQEERLSKTFDFVKQRREELAAPPPEVSETPAPEPVKSKAIAKVSSVKIPWKALGIVGGSLVVAGIAWTAVKRLFRPRQKNDDAPQIEDNARTVWHPDHGYGHIPGYTEDVWKR